MKKENMDCETLRKSMNDVCHQDVQPATNLSDSIHIMVTELRRSNCIQLINLLFTHCGQNTPTRRTSSHNFRSIGRRTTDEVRVAQRSCGTHPPS